MHVHLITFYTVIFLSSTTRTNQQLVVAKANLVQVQQQQQEEEEEEEEGKENGKKDTNQHETEEHSRPITSSSTTLDSDVGRKGLVHTFNSSSSQGGILHRVPKHEKIRKPKYSSIVSVSRRKEEEDDDARESFKLDSISLSDRWTWILSKSATVVGEDDHDYKQYQITPFAQLLMDQHYHPHYHHHPHSPQHHHQHHHDIRGLGSTKHRKIAQEGTTLYSVSWSIFLTTLTIMTMTCLTSLSSLLYRTLILNPSSSNTTVLLFSSWKHISQVLPTLFSSESETVNKIKRYMSKKFLPKSLETMEKMILMEIWRTFWLHTFRLARRYFQYIVGGNYYDSIWECYAPGWLRRGVRSVFVKKVQGSLQRILYGWITKGWEVVSIGFGYGWLDYEMIQDGQVSTGSSSDEESGVGGGIGEGGAVSLSDGSSVQESEQQGHHELLDDIDMDLEMEFEDGLMSSEQQDNDIDNDEGDFDEISYIQEDDGANDDDFMNDDISVACPDDQEC